MTTVELAAETADTLADLYRQLHADPELSFQEHQTAARIVDALADTGCEITQHVGGTGVVAVLPNGNGPVIMLRADMDALPVSEDTGLPYASTKVVVDATGKSMPVAHACGHDMHVAALVGAVGELFRLRERWAGTVVAVFQPAEELASGAQAMIDAGLFERFPRPSIVLGQHVGPLPAGTIGHGQGPVMAATDSVQVTLFGRGGHGSQPEGTIDPVVMAAATVMRLQGIVSREVPSSERAVVTVGRLQAGTKENIIPATAELGVNMRSFTPEVRAQVKAAIERIVTAEAAASNSPQPPHFDWNVSGPVLVNDPAATAKTVAAFEREFGAERLIPLPPMAASEDVGVFGETLGVPTVFWFWGGVTQDVFNDALSRGELPPMNHSPEFAPAIEPTLTTGVQAMTTAALTWLGSAPTS
ncbi:amidohydrolase [Mycolicibacterium helvum]|uniref:Putative amidohydrolase n=1 Tax=Mycolicibacterium helvum TaxID=1534349 RepID=A0A7I7T462_9MYCO|nr:amidohydrolase [Mycolicibacterium helvum]BBY63291.1 putative amidohydrolase [Mycolicibacterium helvum]